MTTKSLIGTRLKRDIFTANGLTLISQHSVLLERHLTYLTAQGIELAEDDVEFPLEKPAPNEALVVHATEEIRDVFQRMRTNESIPMDDVKASIIPAIHQASDFPDLFSVLSGLHAKDDYTYRHNIGVGSLPH